MNSVFVDTFHYLALLNRDDAYHVKALALAKMLENPMVTTEAVLTELLDGCSVEAGRKMVVEWVRRLREDPMVEIIESSKKLWSEAFSLYAKRLDKEWSLTDCISFVVMKQRGITEALTHDHHFKQAGFRVLL